MTIFAVQYLERAPENVTPDVVRLHLRRAFEILPISVVLVGWHLPHELEEAVAEETGAHAADLYRWHPLLASDGGFHLPEEWGTVGYDGQRLRGFQDLPEFTFICPNRSDVSEWIAERIESEAQRGLYQGFFFDRMRFPSPAEDFPNRLTCFCSACRRMATDSGLDLEAIRRYLTVSLAQAGSELSILHALFGNPGESTSPLNRFLDFHVRTITHTIKTAAEQVKSHGLRVGLDCFSPILTHMVGQDLSSLNASCDWIKIMTYPRVFGPAGLPFELLGLVNWLNQRGMDDAYSLKLLTKASDLQFPGDTDTVRKTGLGAEVLRKEIERGRKAGVDNLYAGLALVEMEAVLQSSLQQIRSELEASRSADGLVLSWDLWHIPIERLEEIRAFYQI